MIFSQQNYTSFTNIIDDITFGKPKKTLYTVPITQYSHTYGIVFSSPTFDDTYFFRPMVNICAIEADTML